MLSRSLLCSLFLTTRADAEETTKIASFELWQSISWLAAAAVAHAKIIVIKRNSCSVAAVAAFTPPTKMQEEG
jgi:hypothetical protein